MSVCIKSLITCSGKVCQLVSCGGRVVCVCVWVHVCVCVCVHDLLDVVAEEDKVDAAEAQLGDDEEQVHRPSENRETE